MHSHPIVLFHRLQEYATLGALVASPFVAWWGKRWVDRWEDRLRREQARRCAIDVAVTLSKSIRLCEDVRQALQATRRVPDETIEAAVESLDLSRRTLRLYLRGHIPLYELIPLAAAAERRLGQGHEAMRALQGAPDLAPTPDGRYAGQLESARAELQLVVERLQGLQPDLGRAIAKVDAGWALPD